MKNMYAKTVSILLLFCVVIGYAQSVSEAFKNVMPIPFEQIQASDGSLTQNPGY
jgi:hypothetical protein